MKESVPFQFGIRRLLILTIAVAVISAVASRINAPMLFQTVVAAYFIFLIGWAVMRVPSIWTNFSKLRERSRQLKERRVESLQEARKAKQFRD